MSSGNAWTITAGPTLVDCDPPSTDGTCHAFQLTRGDETLDLTVWLSPYAVPENDIDRVAEAGRTDGRSEVERILGEDAPPWRIIVRGDGRVRYEAR